MGEPFEDARPRLVAVAYGMLGDRSEAEDVVQDAWLRWSADDRTEVHNPAAYLTTVVTRLAVDRLRSARARREVYVGPWLPEPIVTPIDQDPASVVAEAEEISFALLATLERLNPVDRAVFLLREVFDLDYSEIADVIDRSPANCRQIARRARERVGDHRRPTQATREADTQILSAFASAVTQGDVDALTRILAADVIAWSDGGPDRHAARRPIVGIDRVTTYLVNMTARMLGQGLAVEFVRVNGTVGILTRDGDEPFSIGVLEVDDDRIVGIRTVLNPVKLTSARSPA